MSTKAPKSKVTNLRIRQCDEYKDSYSIGSDLEVYLDDMELNTVQSIKFESSIDSATTCTIKMLVNPDIELKENIKIKTENHIPVYCKECKYHPDNDGGYHYEFCHHRKYIKIGDFERRESREYIGIMSVINANNDCNLFEKTEIDRHELKKEIIKEIEERENNKNLFERIFRR